MKNYNPCANKGVITYPRPNHSFTMLAKGTPEQKYVGNQYSTLICNQVHGLCTLGDINEELLSIDGLHLSKLGTERLINNLKLTKTTCCRIGRTQRPGGEPQQWSADHARSAPSQAAKRPKPGGIP